MQADDPRADQWRQTLSDVLEASPHSQADLARTIGRTQQQLSDWMAGRANVPTPDVVFAIEDALDCEDRLGATLGYVRAKPVDTVSVINRDTSLDDVDRATLLRMYRLMLNM
jgi:transcriptional regulator with XRE-family HTH domain